VPHPDKVPLAAWLLLLLGDGESYGRALVGCLGDRGISVNAALVYRTLRALERDGAITSRWTESDHGPRRRSYRLNREGRQSLGEFVADIAATRELHEAFIRAYGRAGAGHEPGARGHPASDESGGLSPPSTDSEAATDPAAAADVAPLPTVGRELLVAWLLLLLRHGDSYGYGLLNALDDRRCGADPAAIYRVLGALERDGLLQSCWRKSAVGPRRHLYRLTPQGHRNLDDLAAAVTATRNGHDVFLHTHEHAPDNPPQRRRGQADQPSRACSGGLERGVIDGP
jgi:PadR family transcriptional regulator, regulatory protein PadR